MDCPDLWRCVADHLGVRAVGRFARAMRVDLSHTHERLLAPMVDRMYVTFVEPEDATLQVVPRYTLLMAITPRNLLAWLRAHGRQLDAATIPQPGPWDHPMTTLALHFVALELALIDLADNGVLSMDAIAHTNSHVYLACSIMRRTEGRMYHVYLPYAVERLRHDMHVPDRVLARLLTRIFLYIDKYYVPKAMCLTIAERVLQLARGPSALGHHE